MSTIWRDTGLCFCWKSLPLCEGHHGRTLEGYGTITHRAVLSVISVFLHKAIPVSPNQNDDGRETLHPTDNPRPRGAHTKEH